VSNNHESFDAETSALVEAGRTDLEPDAGAQVRIERRLSLSRMRDRAESRRPLRAGPVLAALAIAASVALGAGLHALVRPARVAAGRKGQGGATLGAAGTQTSSPVPPSLGQHPVSAAMGDSTGRELLDEAAARMKRGDASGALGKLDEQARFHPTGPLTELREAMIVEALVRAGRNAEAHAHAARFFTTYPTSLLGPAVSDAIGRIPDE
jgi:hypothetical protein